MYSIDKIIGSASLRSSVIGNLTGRIQHFCEDDVDDILSDCYMRTWRHGDFDNIIQARSWVSRMVNSCVLDWMRKRSGWIGKTRLARYEASQNNVAPRIIRYQDTQSLDAVVSGPYADRAVHETDEMSKFVSVDPIAAFDLQCGLIQVLEMAKRDMGKPYHAMLNRIITDVSNGDHPKLTAEGSDRSDKTRAYRIRNYLRKHMVESDWL